MKAKEEGDQSVESSKEKGVEYIKVRARHARDNLEKLDEDNLRFVDANFIPVATLYDLIRLDHELSKTEMADGELRQAVDSLDAVLPFTREQRNALNDRMLLAHESEHLLAAGDWYYRATSEELVQLEHWRQWLNDEFDTSPPVHPSERGEELMCTLEGILECVEEVSPAD